MRQRVFFSLIVVSLICVGCGERGDSPGEGDGSRSPIEEAYAVIDELYDNEASDEEKLAATVEFLEAYPASDHTVGLVGDVVYFRGDQAGDMMGAVEFAERIRSKVSDPVIAAEFDRRLISWYGEAGQKEKMLSIADRLELSQHVGRRRGSSCVTTPAGTQRPPQIAPQFARLLLESFQQRLSGFIHGLPPIAISRKYTHAMPNGLRCRPARRCA